VVFRTLNLILYALSRRLVYQANYRITHGHSDQMGVAMATGRLDVVVPSYNNKSFDEDSFDEQMKEDSERRIRTIINLYLPQASL
jgi:hypothetical protein